MVGEIKKRLISDYQHITLFLFRFLFHFFFFLPVNFSKWAYKKRRPVSRSNGMQHRYCWHKSTNTIHVCKLFHYSATFTFPVTTSLIRAVRYSISRSISFLELFFLNESWLSSFSILLTISFCSIIFGKGIFIALISS